MKKMLVFLLVFLMWLTVVSPVFAAEGQVLGVHILNPSELQDAVTLFDSTATNQWHYVTIPLSLNDLEKKAEWQAFFDQAKSSRVIPVVRLVTRFEGKNWAIPTRRDTVELIRFLSDLDWPTEKRHIIVFNEVNHRTEWGGTIDPVGYAEMLRFTSNWAKSEQKGYVVLPAAMDLAAPNGPTTKEAFAYLDEMVAVDSSIFETVDIWNSHSYPNPGFSAAPTRVAQNSLRGFEYELRYLKEKTSRDFLVMITETGWVENKATKRWLESYYRYASQHIWSHPQVVAVTPFVLRGDPGPFSAFSLIDKSGKPTQQYLAFQTALQMQRMGW